MSPDDERRLIDLADDAHEQYLERLSALGDSHEPKWWLQLGDLLDRLKPLSFERNTGNDL